MKPSLVMSLTALLIGACVPPKALVVEGALSDDELAMGWVDADARARGDFAEQLVVRVVFKGGGGVYLKLQVTNLAGSDGGAALEGRISLADGRRFRARVKKKRGKWSAGRGRLIADLGQSHIDLGVGGGVIHIEGDDFAFDLTLTTDLPPLRPKGGRVDLGGAFYKTTLLVPRGAAQGALLVTPARDARARREAVEAGRMEGGDEAAAGAPTAGEESAEVDEGAALEPLSPLEIELTGVAYAEHRVGVIPPWSLASRWYNLLSIGERVTVVMSAFERGEKVGAGRQGWLLVADDEGIELYEPELELHPVDTFTHKETEYEVPRVLFIQDAEAATFRGVIKAGELSVAKDDLARLSRLERFVVRRLMKPWTFNFDGARYLFKKRQASGYERSYRGEALYRFQSLGE